MRLRYPACHKGIVQADSGSLMSVVVSVIYEGGLKMSYDDVISAVDHFFLPMVSKHCNTDVRSVQTIKGTLLKDKPYLFTFHESILVNLTFQSTLVHWSHC